MIGQYAKQKQNRRFQKQAQFELNTTNADNSKISADPVNSIQQSFLAHSMFQNKVNHKPSLGNSIKPAFGTKAKRQLKQLEGKKLSDISGYQKISYQKIEKYHNRYEQNNAKSTPFLSSSMRFSTNCIKNPGPGYYNFPQIFKHGDEVRRLQGPNFSPFKKFKTQQNAPSKFNYQSEKQKAFQQLVLLSGNSSQLGLDLQRRIKQKQQKIKQKMQKLRQMMKKPQKTDFKSILSRLNQNPHLQHKENLSPHRFIEKKGQKQNALNLKELTKKFLPKMDYKFERQEQLAGSKIVNFKDSHNYHPVFLSKNQNLYSSYIQKKEGPGPGDYNKKTKKVPRRQSGILSKFFI